MASLRGIVLADGKHPPTFVSGTSSVQYEVFGSSTRREQSPSKKSSSYLTNVRER
jgi:hypothetical protein